MFRFSSRSKISIFTSKIDYLKKFSVRLYTKDDYHKWNEFVANAKNATFLFHRDFMEYHQDRFQDFSLLVLDEKDNLKAILPANRVDDVVFSHQGLTYGGLVINRKTKLSDFILLFQEVLMFLNENEIKNFEVKVLPSIYADFPSDELEYVAFLCNADLIRRDTLSTIDLASNFKYSHGRKQEIAKAKTLGFEVKEENSFDAFWNEILIPNLNEKHQAKPVHSLAEITFLKEKFPKNIRQFNVYLGDKIVAGTTIFESKTVAHSQYISGKVNAETNLSLDFLHHHLLTEVFQNKKYFDFGISNENQGQNINSGLLFWKESFGARTITQSFYRFETKNYEKLNSVLL